MKRLIETGKYNAGARPSEDHLGAESFKANNNGAIPPNVGGVDALLSMDGVITPKGFAEYLEQTANLLKAANTLSSDCYRKFCLERGAPIHPARMPSTLVEFFVKFLTDEADVVLDPFAGSNTTGAVAQDHRLFPPALRSRRDGIKISIHFNVLTGSRCAHVLLVPACLKADEDTTRTAWWLVCLRSFARSL